MQYIKDMFAVILITACLIAFVLVVDYYSTQNKIQLEMYRCGK